jgi:outer membrane protein OmpA-like peptidoglycan-associated protein
MVELLAQWDPRWQGKRKPGYPGNSAEDHVLDRRVEVQVK